MTTNRPLGAVVAVALSAAIALLALWAGSAAPIPDGSFFPSSFVIHTVMLVLSIVLIRILSRGRPAVYGLTRGTYRFRPTILLWALPTAVLAVLGSLAPGGGGGSGPAGGLARLQAVIFVWVYASICEEVLTRGLLQTLLSEGRGPRTRRFGFSMPVVTSALFFGAMHIVLVRSMGAAAAPVIVMVVLLGLLAGRLRETTGSLIPAIIVHALFNVGGMGTVWIIRWFRG